MATGRRAFRIAGAAVLAAVLALGGYAVVGARHDGASLARPALNPAAPETTMGAAAFIGAGFGGISLGALETNAIPWKLTAAALVLDEQTRDPAAATDAATLRKVMRRFGFLYPARLDGTDLPAVPAFSEKPLGMTHGFIAPVGGVRIEVANLGCAACHAGVAYAPDGLPDTARAVPGMANTSLDLESYTQAIFAALNRHAADPALLAAADTLFPEMGWQERASLRWIVLPLAQRRLKDYGAAERALTFPNGLPGATNGVAALKFQSGTPLIGGGAGERGFVSIPDLGLRHRRSRLLADGAYATPSGKADAAELAAITSFFTVPSMGVKPEEAQRHIPEARAIFGWLAQYRPQPFPGPVDLAQAQRGAGIYAKGCAACHGSFDWNDGAPLLTDYPDWIGDVGTDRLRLEVLDPALAEAIRASAYRDAIRVQDSGGYAAPPLAGVWASAPYLHNGAVPSLAALLDPKLRPRRFMVGGHALDWDSMGIRLTAEGRYPAGYRPIATPQWVDTRQPGLGNGGHEYGSDLPAADRQALIAFLKLL
ncbi:hypothetical protein [Porphyrobacter sp. AAP60]|uniref:c-type cytochrome n=1 Tax=Porphyrobacter sp. AAP60 TaxID=1523423 RepID=UPI0006B96793|nr:hypothetical protein [Porphyrobacter sp. AAP60]